jgi:hypothetical protein
VDAVAVGYVGGDRDGDGAPRWPVAWENAGMTSDDQEWLLCDEKMNVLPLETEGPALPSAWSSATGVIRRAGRGLMPVRIGEADGG